MGEVDHSKNLREKPPLTRVEIKESHQDEAHQEGVHQEETPIGGTLTLKSIMVTLEEHLEVVLLVMIHLIILNCSGKEALPLLEFLVSIRRQCLIRQTVQQYEI